MTSLCLDHKTRSLPHNSLQLLGAFRLIQHREPVVLGQLRLEELIALLAIQPGTPITRARIGYAFWPDSSDKQARTNVRSLLHKLKKAWPDATTAIAVERTAITWRADGPIAVDVQRFGVLHDQAIASRDAVERIQLLTTAVQAYGGDLLPDCYAEWVLAERERLRGKYATLLEQLVTALLAQRDSEEALAQAKTLLHFDPLRENAYRLLMQAYAALGDRAAALRVYHTCASTLQHELGVEPSPATEQLRSRLLQLQEQPRSSGAPQAKERQRLVGRHEEWRQLQAAWQRAKQGEARFVLIWGEAGIGKTRLVEELLDWVQRQGHVSASSRSYAVEGALTYAPIAEWLRSPGILPALESIDDLWRVELARLLPGLSADRPDLPPPGPMTEDWQQQRFFQGIVHALQVTSGPLLLHLDDMQWSDVETLTLLQFLLHGVRNHPVLLIGGIRTEDAGDNQALASFVNATRHAGQLDELRLGPLSAQETAELAAQTAGEQLGTDVAETLFTVSEGHPLYLVEAVRSGLAVSLEETNVAPAISSDIVGVAAMPARIYNLLTTRLAQLSETAQQVAGMAAVIGRAFDYEILQAAVSLDETALVDALDELWRRRIIREQAGDGYDFSHDRIREVAYQEISRARRRLYHRRVAEALEMTPEADLDDIAGELAAHYAQAGDASAAYRFYRRAATIALEQYALRDAELMLDAASRYVPDDPVPRLELLQEQDRVFEKALRIERWGENLDAERMILETIRPPEPHLLLAYELSRSQHFMSINQFDLAATAIHRAIHLAEERDDGNALITCYQVFGTHLWSQSRMVKARQAYGRMMHYARLAGDRAAEGRSLVSQAAVGMFSGAPVDEIMGQLQGGLAIADAFGDKFELANIYEKSAYARIETAVGHWTETEQELQQALQYARECGDLRQETLVLDTLGRFYIKAGDYRSAAQVLAASEKIEREQQHYWWRNWVTAHYVGAMKMEIGDLDSALPILAEASEQLGRVGHLVYEVRARCDLGFVHHLGGDDRQALSLLDDALAMMEGLGELRFDALVNTRIGYILEAGGRSNEAYVLYGWSRELQVRMGQHYLATNALAGIARIERQRGQHDVALDHAATIWNTIGGQEADATIETARTLGTCYTIFDAHSDPRAAAVLAMAWQQLQRRVSTIDDPDRVEQFWQLDDHRFFRDIRFRTEGVQ